MARATTHKFQTQAKEILDLMVYSVYSNKDIFLRELISNSSDALDKLRFRALEEKELEAWSADPHVRLATDAATRTLEVSDNGVGMDRKDLVEFLGTIARSGTREFSEALKAAKSASAPDDLIGQFGVGFYASFMVAKRVQVLTRKAGDDGAWLWDSSGDGTYTLREAKRDAPGTTVTLFLKDADEEAGLRDYASEWVLREIVRKYSDFVSYPIRTEVTRQEIERDDEGRSKEGAKPTTVRKDEVLNSMKAIWTRSEGEVTAEEYLDFYRHLTRDWGEPLARIVSRAEGTSEFKMLLYLPSRAPMDLFWRDAPHGVQLYIKRVFIMNDCKDLLPFHLRFVKGVVDSEDLPLNISREVLQQDRHVRIIRKNLVKKVMDTLGKMRDDEREKFEGFWREFGKVLKEGLVQEPDQRDALLDLALFESTHGEAGALTTLGEYLERMPEGQESIYFLTGRSRDALVGSPHLEAFAARGMEVLLLSEPVDELWADMATPYREKGFVNAAKGTVNLPDVETTEGKDKEGAPDEEAWKPLLAVLQEALDVHVKAVRFSTRLTESPACLVVDTGDMTPQLEQMMRSMGQDVPPLKRILELNPAHPVVQRLKGIHEVDTADPRLPEYAVLLHGHATLAEGGVPAEPAVFAKHVAALMGRDLQGPEG
ncbi:MAG: molecular chaperone HtpG [Pseudomonadota bacterium]